MKGKYTRLAIVFVVIFQIFMSSISQVYAEVNNTSKQPAVCAGPSDTMQQYFQFQRDALLAISSNASNGKLSVGDSDGWLFTKKDLTLKSSALDYVVENIWGKTSSIISTTATSMALILMASSSVIESDVEGLVIFFKDRPIVRDYKEMLDIETEIFNTAFFLSKSIDLTRALQGNAVVKQFNSVVKEYQASGLLRDDGVDANGSVSMVNILSALASMNASMKFFISMGGEVGLSELGSYRGCLHKGECNDTNFVLGFSDEAISKLKEEYGGNWKYGKCNSFASNFKNSISKSAKNNGDTIRDAWNDIKVSWDNLINALIGKGTWSKVLTDPCQMTDYERAQLDAYYGGDRTCGEGISISSLLAKIKEYENNKKTLNGQTEMSDNLVKDAGSSEPPSLLNVAGSLSQLESTEDMRLMWYRLYSGESTYNSEFSYGMNYEFSKTFNEVTEQLEHSQRAAMASDLSYELTKFKGLVDQIDAAMKGAKELEKDLQDIADYQCSM